MIFTQITCKELRDSLVETVVKYLKHIKEWSDEQITDVDVSVDLVDNTIQCSITVKELEVDSRYTLCDLLTGVLYNKGHLQSEFLCKFPDAIFADITA